MKRFTGTGWNAKTLLLGWLLLEVLLTISVSQLTALELKEMVRSKGMHLSKSLLTRSKDLLLTGDIVKPYMLL